MERQTQIQYSYLEHLGDTLNGNFYKSMDSSLSEIIIFYRNKTKGTTNRFTNINEFVDSYCASLKKNIESFYDFDYALLDWSRGTKLLIRTWKQRIVYLIENKKDILITLLSRKDFDSKQAVAETILSIHDWLCTLEKSKDITDWILNIQNIMPTFDTYKVAKSDSKIEENGQENKILKNDRHNFFWQLLNGKTDEEKKELFDFITSKLLDKYINKIDEGTYKWRIEKKTGLSYICGLIYVLTQRKYISLEISPKKLAELIINWLINDFEFDSLEKGLQTARQQRFTNDNQLIYTEDFFEYFSHK